MRLLFCYLIIIVAFGNLQKAFSQEHGFVLSGIIKDSLSSETLVGASVLVEELLSGTTTNAYGFFSIRLPANKPFKLRISYVGYARKVLEIQLSSDMRLDIMLSSLDKTLGIVEISDSRLERAVESAQLGLVSIPIEQIKQVPAFLGEVDILKVLQLLPGVQSGNEGSTGLYVRGGGPDQNLILLDGVPVYNANHLFGFFSIFNADAVKHVDLYKGGHPARYGGRLSSVLDITMKEGNMQNFKAEAGIGLVASRLFVEGPLQKDKTSFMFSARRTYIDALARPFQRLETGVVGYYFYDLNAKINHIISNKDRIFVSAYTGYDQFSARYRSESGFDDFKQRNDSENYLDWGNITTSIRWNRIINNKLFMNVQGLYTRYRFRTRNVEKEQVSGLGSSTTNTLQYAFISSIVDVGLQANIEYSATKNHHIRSGGGYILHQFRPGTIQQKGNIFENPFEQLQGSKAIYVHDAFVFVEDEWKISQRMKVLTGARFNLFYAETTPYLVFEPRLSGRYLINTNLSAKLGYARMNQFLHLLTNSGIGLPTDLWVPATNQIKPQRSDQVSGGLALELPKKQIELSFEAYYKVMENLLEYQEGSSFLGINADWQERVTQGRGEAYGFEMFAHKKEGKTNGWIGYTLSWSNRQFDALNEGKVFPYRYDRRHDISFVINRQLDDNWRLSGVWVYGTGNAVTLPIARYNLMDQTGVMNQYVYYGERNSYRMAPYHRLDLGLTHTRFTKYGERNFSFGLYNAYNRRNPFFIDLSYQIDGTNKFIQYSLFPVIPYVSWNFKFN